jgi:hypothetical protein
VPDIFTAVPDLAHEMLRQETVTAISRLDDHVGQLEDSFLLARTAADSLQVALTAVTQLQATVTTQAGQIADLQKRVAALEPKPAPTPTPTP